jgi:flagellin FlaB
VKGGVDTDNSNTPCATQITFYLITAAGSPVDLDKTVITYTDNENSKSQDYVYDSSAPQTKGPGTIPPSNWANSNGWVYNGIIYSTNDNFLEQGEKYKVVVDLHTFIPSDASHPLPVAKEQVKLEIKPSLGAVFAIQVKMPDEIAQDTYYVVY